MFHLENYNKVIKKYRLKNPALPTEAYMTIQQMLTDVYYIQIIRKDKIT